MDKYEYKQKTEEMLRCVAAEDYERAESIADSIDWRRVKSVSMLCTVSDIYDECQRYEDARDILFIAYDRAPSNRKIIFGLTELAIKTGQYREAKDCYDEYVAVAPHDGNKYVLQYELLKMDEAPLEQQIEALEEYKRQEYTERWAYELAKLYEKAGMTAKCIAECDDVFLWFSDGKYVRKALELKRKYRPLTANQTDALNANNGSEEDPEEVMRQKKAELLLKEQTRGQEEETEESSGNAYRYGEEPQDDVYRFEDEASEDAAYRYEEEPWGSESGYEAAPQEDGYGYEAESQEDEYGYSNETYEELPEDNRNVYALNSEEEEYPVEENYSQDEEDFSVDKLGDTGFVVDDTWASDEELVGTADQSEEAVSFETKPTLYDTRDFGKEFARAQAAEEEERLAFQAEMERQADDEMVDFSQNLAEYVSQVIEEQSTQSSEEEEKSETEAAGYTDVTEPDPYGHSRTDEASDSYSERTEINPYGYYNAKNDSSVAYAKGKTSGGLDVEYYTDIASAIEAQLTPKAQPAAEPDGTATINMSEAYQAESRAYADAVRAIYDEPQGQPLFDYDEPQGQPLFENDEEYYQGSETISYRPGDEHDYSGVSSNTAILNYGEVREEAASRRFTNKEDLDRLEMERLSEEAQRAAYDELEMAESDYIAFAAEIADKKDAEIALKEARAAAMAAKRKAQEEALEADHRAKIAARQAEEAAEKAREEARIAAEKEIERKEAERLAEEARIAAMYEAEVEENSRIEAEAEWAERKAVEAAEQAARRAAEEAEQAARIVAEEAERAARAAEEEAERLARIAEEEARIAAEKEEERKEAERLAAEAMFAAQIEAEQEENQLLEAEAEEADRLATEAIRQAERQDAERKLAEKLAEEARLAIIAEQEQAEAERMAAEAEKAETDRLNAELEKIKAQKEAAEREYQEIQQKAAQRALEEAEQYEAARRMARQVERAREKKEIERAEREAMERARQEQESRMELVRRYAREEAEKLAAQRLELKKFSEEAAAREAAEIAAREAFEKVQEDKISALRKVAREEAEKLALQRAEIEKSKNQAAEEAAAREAERKAYDSEQQKMMDESIKSRVEEATTPIKSQLSDLTSQFRQQMEEVMSSFKLQMDKAELELNVPKPQHVPPMVHRVDSNIEKAIASDNIAKFYDKESDGYYEVDSIASALENMAYLGAPPKEIRKQESSSPMAMGSMIRRVSSDSGRGYQNYQEGRGQEDMFGGIPLEKQFDLREQGRVGIDAGLTEEQRNLFSYFVPVRGMSEQLVDVLRRDLDYDRRGTSRTGNLLVVGDSGNGKTVLAVDIVKAIQKQRAMRSGKIAIISAEALNKKDITSTIGKIIGGALIIESAGQLSQNTVHALNEIMNGHTDETLFVLEDEKAGINELFSENVDFASKFSSMVEVPVFIDDELVTFGQSYAMEHGFKIDEMAILALYSRIDMLQRDNHNVTISEVKYIMDEAFERARASSMRRTMTSLFKRTDHAEITPLREEDFAL